MSSLLQERRQREHSGMAKLDEADTQISGFAPLTGRACVNESEAEMRLRDSLKAMVNLRSSSGSVGMLAMLREERPIAESESGRGEKERGGSDRRELGCEPSRRGSPCL